MKLLEVVSKTAFSVARKVKPALPTIEIVAGSALIIGGAAYLIAKADDISEVHEKVREAKEEIKNVDADEAGWEEMDESKSHYILRNAVDCGVDYLKATGVGLGCIGGGLALVYISHASLTKQLEATAASLAGVTYTFNKYRDRVRNDPDAGEDKDTYYYTGYAVKHVTEIETQPDGTILQVDKTVLVKPDDISGKSARPMFSFWWGPANPNWTGNPEADKNFLYNSLSATNFRMGHRDGWLTWNGIAHDGFGADITVMGQTAGAMSDWPDGTVGHSLRFNPTSIQGLLDGETEALLIIEYDDGSMLETDLFSKENKDFLNIPQF